MQNAIQEERKSRTPILTELLNQGINAFLCFGELTATNRAGGPIPADIAAHIKNHKAELIAELEYLNAPGKKISFDIFIQDRLLP